MSTIDLAKRKAKYGHRDWILWETGSGSWETAKASLESIRVMAKAVHLGRKGFLVHANCGTLAKVFPRLARIMLSNAKAGHQYQDR